MEDGYIDGAASSLDFRPACVIVLSRTLEIIVPPR